MWWRFLVLIYGPLTWILVNILLQARHSFRTHLSIFLTFCGLNILFDLWPIELEVSLSPILYIGTLWFFTRQLRAFFLLHKLSIAIIATFIVTLFWQLDFTFWHHLLTRSSTHFMHMLLLLSSALAVVLFIKRLRLNVYLAELHRAPWRVPFATSSILFYLSWFTVLSQHFSTHGLLLPFELTLLLIFFTLNLLLALLIYTERLRKKYSELVALQSNQTTLFISIQEQNAQLRRFRHDYLNTLSALQVSVASHNLKEITQIYHSIIQPTQIELKDIKLNDLPNLNTPELRNLIILKQDYATQHHITLCIHSTATFTISPDLIHDIYQILALWLDNAIEASPEKRFVHIYFVSLPEQQISIVNDFNVRPNIVKWANAGFTTKAYHQGIGLSTVSKIIEHNPKLDVITKVTNSTLTQTLIWS